MKGVHVPVIVEIVRGMSTVSPVRYLELGIGNGQTFRAVAPLCDEAWAVDRSGVKLSNAMKADNVLRFSMTTDDFFEGQVDKAFDVIFIDALHEKEQVLKDFDNSFKAVKDNGLILMHDGFPPNKAGMGKNRSWNTWEAISRIRHGSTNGAYECTTLPFGHGVTIIRKAAKQLPWYDGEQP